MSVNYHANQYEQAFNTKRMQSWEVPIPVSRRPYPREGFTQIRANDRGHLLPNVPRSRASPWGTFVGTWDMPTKLPGNNVLNPTARSERVTLRLGAQKEEADEILCGALKPTRAIAPVCVDMQEVSPPEGYILRKDQERPDTPTKQGFPTTLTAVIKGSGSGTRMADLEAKESAHDPVDWPLPGSKSPKSASPHSTKSGSPLNAAASPSTMSPGAQLEGEDDAARTPVNWPIARSPKPPLK